MVWREEVLALLRCPVCRERLGSAGAALRCAQGHAYDVARQGYVSLLVGRARNDTADTTRMVAARVAFLGAGHFAPLSAALAQLAVPQGPVIDLGAGTGQHTAAVLDAVDGPGLALDSSKAAARVAARAHPRLGSVVADAWSDLPVAAGVASTVLTVFAPRNPSEIARVLAPGGRWLIATPTPRHLAELVRELGMVTVDPRKDERLETQVAGWELVEERLVEAPLRLSADEVRAVVAMGPSARHDVVVPSRAAGATLSVRVAAYVRG